MKNKKHKMSDKPSICLTTYFDKNFEKLGHICLKSIKKYGGLYNYDVKLLNVKSNRPPAWNKILIIKKLLEDKKNYDFILWIDSDALFVRFDCDISKEIELGKDFYLVKHNLNGKELPNTGFFLIRNSDWSKNFIKRIWGEKKFIYHHWWENAAVNYLLGFDVKNQNQYKNFISYQLNKLKFKNYLKNFNRLKSLSYLFKLRETNKQINKPSKIHSPFINKVKWLDSKWNEITLDSQRIKGIVFHYPSLPYEERLTNMKKAAKITNL